MSMMIFEKLVELYEQEGLDVAAGLNPTLANDFFAAPYTWLIRDGVSVTDALGISPTEIYLLESLARVKVAQKVFIVGNGFGWSSIAMALANPDSRVVAIDSCYDENTLEGIDVTNRIARKAGINVTALKATSPNDVANVIGETLGSVDLAFIDGFHGQKQILKDYRALAPFVDGRNGLFLFHDILSLNLSQSFQQIVGESGWQGKILPSTTSGMALLVPELTPNLSSVARAWGGKSSAWSVIRAAAAAQGQKTGVDQRKEVISYVRNIDERPEKQ